MLITSTSLTRFRSDADPDVLADYVLALLRHDGSPDEVRKLCEEEIPDFLKEGLSPWNSNAYACLVGSARPL